VPRWIGRRRSAERIRRPDNTVPWLAIAAAGTRPAPIPRGRSRRRSWWLVPAAIGPLAVVWLIVPCASVAHDHVAAPGLRRAAAHRSSNATGSPAASAASDPFTPALRRWLGRRGDVSAAVEDLHSGRTWVYRPGHPEHTASIVKVDILATLLHQRQDDGGLSAEDQELATGMIEQSDDDDATDLWNAVGGASAVQDFDDAVPMHHTTTNIAWGLTTTTPQDQLKLLRTVLFAGPLLTRGSRDYEYGLMRHIIPFDTWGVTAGPEGHAKVAFKNGWLPYDGSWQVNSIGSVRGAGRHYLIAVMTDGSATEGAGIDTIERIARAAWQDLDAHRS
jgi:hypothetical protein